MPGEATPPRGTRNQKRSNGTECKNERSGAAITLGPEYQTVQNSAANADQARRSLAVIAPPWPERLLRRVLIGSFADCRNRRVRRQIGGYLKRCTGNGKGDSAPGEHETR